MKYRNLFIATICSFFAVASCSSCHDEKDPIIPEPVLSHTLLIYMMGDNSLSDFCNTNMRLIKNGLIDATEDMNVVIYKDNRDNGDNLPKLFQLKRSIDKKTQMAKIDTINIKEYDADVNSCNPAIFKEIVNTTFEKFNTEVKGIEFWSHGMSWIPSSNSRKTRYIGQDEYDFFELWDIRKALEDCPHLDYMLFDCCFCGTAEVVYEFNKVTDHIYAPITEIMGYGFPYRSMIPILANCQKKEDVCKALEKCMDDFANGGHFNGDGYTISLFKTSKAENLAKSVAKLRSMVPEKLDFLKTNANEIEKEFQHYGRNSVGCRYYYYELHDYIDYLAEGGSEEIKNIVKEIEGNNIVVKYACSKEFTPGYESIDLKGCQGLGVSIPEFFSLTYEEERFTNYYGKTKWGQTLGF